MTADRRRASVLVARTGAPVAVALALVAGCSTTGPLAASPRDAVDVATLDARRTPYTGDASAVVALTDALGLGRFGAREIALSTDAPPYAVTVSWSAPEGATPEEVAELMADRAVLLLATVGNLDEVRWELPGASGSLTRDAADRLAGAPVARLGADEDGLVDLVARLDG